MCINQVQNIYNDIQIENAEYFSWTQTSWDWFQTEFLRICCYLFFTFLKQWTTSSVRRLCSVKPALQSSIKIHYTLFNIIVHTFLCLSVWLPVLLSGHGSSLCAWSQCLYMYWSCISHTLDVKQSIRGTSPARSELQELESCCCSCFSKGKITL